LQFSLSLHFCFNRFVPWYDKISGPISQQICYCNCKSGYILDKIKLNLWLPSVLVCIFPLIIGLCTVLLQAPCLSTAFSLLDSLKNLQLPFIKTHLWISQTGSA
jgi:hypothetical protein